MTPVAGPFAAIPGVSERPTLILIDGSSYVYRAYHAVPHLSNRQGIPTNAVYGFTNMLLKAIRDAKPTHLAIAFDRAGRTFRDDIDPQYKATRSEPPPDLIPQFDIVRQVVEALNIPMLEAPNFEADDVIGTVAARARDKGFRVVIVTGDKDFMQLVGPEILLFDSMRDKWTGAPEVEEKLGVGPDRVIDLMSLCGDSVDNVRGVPGVGPKTAAQLLQKFGSLDALMAQLDSVERPKLRESLRANLDTIQRARQLVRIRLDVPISVEPDDLGRKPAHLAELSKLFESLEFTRLIRDLPATLGSAGSAPSLEEVQALPPPKVIWASPEVCADVAKVEEAVRFLRAQAQVAIHVEVSGEGPIPDRVRGLALAGGGEQARTFYVAYGATFPAAIRQLLEDPAIPKVGFGLKRAWTALRRVGIQLPRLSFDCELACYLLDAGRKHLIEDVSREQLGAVPPALTVPPAQETLQLAFIEAESAAPASCARAEASLRLAPILKQSLQDQELLKLFDELEMPLLPVLAEMEWVGVLMDRSVLAAMSAQVATQLEGLARRIHELAGHEFNIASNKQLGQVLFEELKLPVVRRTKTGPSVEQEVLERLAPQHPLPALVIEHRSLAKLKGTYLDALPELIDPRDGRIHTTFNQAIAATGRLSSSDPNLQNIPTRTELGRKIREAFVAPPGSKLISADYSQIELRVLAHVSGDPAAEVFSVPTGEVTPQMRRTAKAINFGIAYGQSAFGLSQRLEMPAAEAQAIIDRYFARYSGVRAWLDRTIEEAKTTGVVSTLFGRRRLLPDIHSRNQAVRQAAERMAVNTPIQGTAADLIKRAMLAAVGAVREQGLAARMILQVHDELLFEVPESEVDRCTSLAREAMGGAGKFDVPLVVTVGIGNNWAEIH
jgi:DNA polymerase-1